MHDVGSPPAAGLRQTLDDAAMSRFQWTAIAVIVGLNALDGFDVLAITFAAPGIARAWGTSYTGIGGAIAAGLVGMSVGSITLPTAADRIGRRPTIMVCLGLMALGTFLSATATNLAWLAAWRVLTGIGIGGMVPSINAMIGEFSNKKNRSLAVALMAVGFSIGGALGGVASAVLLAHFEWQAVFVFGGCVCVLFMVLTLALVPESIDSLITGSKPGALARVNAVLRRMGQDAVAVLPPPASIYRMPLVDICRKPVLFTTVAMTCAFLMHITTFYFVMSWIPQLVRDMGWTSSMGASVSAIASIGGVIASVLFGVRARTIGIQRLTVWVMAASAVATVLFGMALVSLPVFVGAAFVAGGLVSASVGGLYALVAQAFPTGLRATAGGFVIGVGRIGGVAAPLISGYLFSRGHDRAMVATVMAIGSAVAAIAVASIGWRRPSPPGQSSAKAAFANAGPAA